MAHEILCKDIVNLHRYIFLRYEDLVSFPEVWLGKICTLAGIDTCSPQEILDDRNRKYFSVWDADYQKDRDIIVSEYPEIVRYAAEFGYTFDEPFVVDSNACIASENGS